MIEEKVIMRDSPEAASLKTVTGWVSRLGHFYGDNEDIARYDGCTHQRCGTEGCDGVTSKHRIYCESCEAKRDWERYDKLEKQEWDGIAPLYSHTADKYFFDEDSLTDYLFDVAGPMEPEMIEDLQLVICKPMRAWTIEPTEHYCDIFPEDGDEGCIPDEILAAFEHLNQVILACSTPISWEPSKIAAVIKLGEPNAQAGEERTQPSHERLASNSVQGA